MLDAVFSRFRSFYTKNASLKIGMKIEMQEHPILGMHKNIHFRLSDQSLHLCQFSFFREFSNSCPCPTCKFIVLQCQIFRIHERGKIKVRISSR